MSKEILKTLRLRLSEIVVIDAPFIHELMNEPEWLCFIGDRSIKTITDAEAYIKNKLQKSYREFGFGFYKVSLLKDKTPIGICGLVKRPTLMEPDLGFGFLKRYTGKGYARESAEALLRYGQDTLKLPTIFAFTDPQNEKSIQLILRLGMTFVEQIEEEEYGISLLFST